MPSPTVSRRSLLVGASLSTCALVTGCRSRVPVEPDPVHVSLSAPASHGQVVLARANGTIDAQWEEITRQARAHRASIGIAGHLLRLSGRQGQLVPAMPAFAGDVLDPDRTNADLVFLVEADSADTAQQRSEGLLGSLGDLATPVWQAPVSHALAGASAGRALTTNVFGFNEGFGNPAPGVDVTIIGDRGRHPAWAVGGSLLALRIVRVSHELWDRDEPDRHARIIGRHPDGTWLDGTSADSPAPFAGDPEGAMTPLDSHVRRANPHGAPRVELTRRGWNYASAEEEGTLFCAYTNDLGRFETVQRRVIGDSLSPYTLTVGGGYYFVPPPHDGWWRRRTSGTAGGGAS